MKFKKRDKIRADRAIRRKVDLELGIEPYKTKIHKNKNKYKRKNKHKDDWTKED